MIELTNNLKYFIIIILIITLILIINNTKTFESFTDTKKEFNDYIQSFNLKENRYFPFRYFTDINNNVLPFVSVTGFFRD